MQHGRLLLHEARVLPRAIGLHEFPTRSILFLSCQKTQPELLVSSPCIFDAESFVKRKSLARIA